MNKILITGANGMLGRTLCKSLREFEIIPTDLPNEDITQAAIFDRLIKKHRPDTVIHCAAMTAVDNCETQQDLAFKLNAIGSANVAFACHRNNARLIAISTDYVFDGDKDTPYTEFDLPSPRSVYGKSKYAGEQAVRTHCPNHIIARLSWLYGAGGPSFIHTMLKLADGSRPELKVVNDQLGNPTSTLAVADALRNLINRPEIVGTFHLTCSGEATWFVLACELFRQAGISQKVIPCTTMEYPRPAPRPRNSRLEKLALRLHGLPEMPDWRDALKHFLCSNQGTSG